MSSPPLTGRLPAQAAGLFVTGSSLAQALIQRRQRLTYELRLHTLAILSRSAQQPAAGGSAVAPPRQSSSTASSAAQNWPRIRRHAKSRDRSCSAHVRACRATLACAPNCAARSPSSSGSVFLLANGSKVLVGISLWCAHEYAGRHVIAGSIYTITAPVLSRNGHVSFFLSGRHIRPFYG